MYNKELLIDFIEYAKSMHVMPILHSNIEPLVDDYLRQQNLQQCSVMRSVCFNDCGDTLISPNGKVCLNCGSSIQQTDA